MSSLLFVRAELGRIVKTPYFWVFISVAVLWNSLLNIFFFFVPAEITVEEAEHLPFVSLSGSIAFFVAAVGIMAISRDFHSKYIQRLIILLGSWQRVMMLKAAVVALLAIVVTVASVVVAALWLEIMLLFAPRRGETFVNDIGRTDRYADSGNVIFSPEVWKIVLLILPIAILVGLFAHFLGWLLHSAVLFMAVYYPLVLIVEGLASIKVPYLNWYLFGGAVGNAVNYYSPNIIRTAEEAKALQEQAPSLPIWLFYHPPQWVSGLIVLAYVVVAFILAVLRNRRIRI